MLLRYLFKVCLLRALLLIPANTDPRWPAYPKQIQHTNPSLMAALAKTQLATAGFACPPSADLPCRDAPCMARVIRMELLYFSMTVILSSVN